MLLSLICKTFLPRITETKSMLDERSGVKGRMVLKEAHDLKRSAE